jgi:hypothetical protein
VGSCEPPRRATERVATSVAARSLLQSKVPPPPVRDAAVYPPSPLHISEPQRRGHRPALVSTVPLAACAVLIAALVGCGSSSRQEEMQASQASLTHEAMDLQRCFNANGYSSQQCADQRKTYESDLAAFKAEYAK